MNEWQPIETAPKDGTRILIVYQHLVIIGWFRGDELYTDSSRDVYGLRPICHGGIYGRVATHWMPLPDPPTASPHTAEEK